MLRKMFIVLVALLLLALIPGSALAQADDGREHSDDVLLRINGPIELAADDTVGTVISISGEATIAGRVTDALVVLDGSATLAGVVEGDVIVVSGDLAMLDTARIAGDLNLFDSNLERAGGAVVGGEVHERSTATWSAWDTFAVSAFLWVALTLLVLVAALLFAAIGGRQLVTASQLVTERPGGTLLAAVLGGLLIPVVAVVAMLTIFGIPIGLTLLLLVMPIMFMLGYIVTGTTIGLAIVARNRPLVAIDHPYLAAILGVMILSVFGLVPFAGGVVQFVAAVLGAGALTMLAWTAWRKGGVTQVAATPSTQEQALPAH